MKYMVDFLCHQPETDVSRAKQQSCNKQAFSRANSAAVRLISTAGDSNLTDGSGQHFDNYIYCDMRLDIIFDFGYGYVLMWQFVYDIFM